MSAGHPEVPDDGAFLRVFEDVLEGFDVVFVVRDGFGVGAFCPDALSEFQVQAHGEAVGFHNIFRDSVASSKATS